MKIMRFILLVVLCVTACSQNRDDLTVKQTFEGYRSAILNNNGDAAYNLIDKNTRRWYSESLQRALTFNRAEIMKLGVMDKMQVIMIRHRVPSDELLEMNGEDLFKYAVDHGWVSKNSVLKLQIGKIDVQGDFATGVVRSNDQDTPLRFHFYRNEGNWGIDLTVMTRMGEAAFLKEIKESGETEIDYIFKLTQIVSGKPVQESVWEPLKN